MEWWSRFIEVATLIAIGVTAWATSRTWGSQKRRDAEGLPYVVFPYGRTMDRTGERPIMVAYKLPEGFSDVWEISSARVRWPFWRRIISAQGGWHQEGLEPVWFSAKKWERTLSWNESGTQSGTFLLHPQSPSRVDLRFKISLRVDARKSSRFDTSIRITD